MADEEQWSNDANEAVHISIVQAGNASPEALSTFHPKFTYPIFGDEERIFGYRDLCINLRFAAHDLRPNLEINYEKKFPAVGDTKATNIAETLREWMPSETFEKVANFNSRVQHDNSASGFEPPGTRLGAYQSKGRNFEIWSCELIDLGVRALVARLQIFVSFFIEGGTPLELEDQDWTLARWRVYFVYEKLSHPAKLNTSLYSIVGYSTSYRFVTYLPAKSTSKNSYDFTLPPAEPLDPSSLPCRARISQFLILPSHHSHGHGTHLYNAMVQTFLASPTITEVTVEDPNEAFDDLRDYCDYTRLAENNTFSQIKFNTSIDPRLTQKRIGVCVPTSKLVDMPLLEALRKKNKIAHRQFYRLVELYLLSQIKPYSRQAGTARLTQRGRSSDLDDRAFYYWRLLVKQRVYKKNKDALIQLDRVERVDRVEQTVGEVAGDYERLLRGMDKWKEGEEEAAGGVERRERRVRGKRKTVVEDDDDEDGDEVMNGVDCGQEEPDKKRIRNELP